MFPPPPNYANNGKVLLDVGCGYEARVIQLIQKKIQFKKCIGLDFEISPSLIGHPNFQFIEGDVNTILPSLETKSVDFIIFLSVLEHLEDVLSIFIHSNRILKENGYLFFNCPNWFGKWILEHVVSNRFIDPYGEITKQIDTHKMYYSLKEMWPLLVKAGFLPSNIKIWQSNLFCSISGYAVKI